MLMNNVVYDNEKDMYQDIIDSITVKLNFFGYKYEVFKTWKEFSPRLKALIPNAIQILKKTALPDIIVVYTGEDGKQRFLIIEVKDEKLKIIDMAQAKMYGDIFNADAVLLVSLIKIRKSFSEFNKINPFFMKCSNGAQLYTCTLEHRQLQLQTCFPNDGRLIK